MVLILLLVLLLALDYSAMRWGVDSRDRFDSPEWERRRRWRGYGGDR